MPLNPNAPVFSFNVNASEFVPGGFTPSSAAPAADAGAAADASHAGTNGAGRAAEPKHVLHKDAPVFVPGGATVAPAGGGKEHVKDGKHHHHDHKHGHHDKKHASPNLKHQAAPAPGTSWASLAKSSPSKHPVADAPKVSPMPQSADKKASAHASAPASARQGKKFTIKELLDLKSRAHAISCTTSVCMVEFNKTLIALNNEFDPQAEPSRQQHQIDASGRAGASKGGQLQPGTPKKGRGGKNDMPLRDKTGKVIEVKALELSENRWKPSKPTDEEEKVYKTAKGIMNKLTLEKFDKLYGELLNVGITNASLLRGFVVLIYDKAVLEPTFIAMYARMCQKLAQDLPELSDEDGVLPFKDVLVGKCRSEFATMGEEPPAEELEKLSADDREGKLRKIRQRMLGNVEFIGELFKVDMVGEEMVCLCLDKLLDAIKVDQDKIQPICKLLEGVGKLLEEKDKAAVDGYFTAFEALISEEGRLNSRFKFMLMDLIEVRSKGWKARREVAGPKMLEEIQKEVDKENRYTEKKKDPNADKKKEAEKKKKDSKNRPAKKEAKAEDDGWSQVTTVVKGKGKQAGKKGSEPGSPVAAAAKGKAGGGGGASAFNRGGFAALMAGSDGSEDEDVESESEDEDEDEDEEEPETPIPTKVVHGPEIDEEARNKVGFIIEEFMCIHDVEEAVACMVDLHETAKYSKAVLDEEVVRRGLSMALDQSPKECKLMASMYGKLIERELLVPEDASRGFCDILQDLPDIAIDIPNAPQLLASIAKDMLENNHLAPQLIAAGVKELQEQNPNIGKHFNEVLTIVSK